MAFTISSKSNEKTFADKELVNISSKPGFDFQINPGFEFMLTVQFDPKANKCVLLNQFNNKRFLFKGKPLPARLDIDRICKIMIEGSDEFITIKVVGSTFNNTVAQENISEEDIRAIYGNDVNALAKLKIEKRKSEIEQARVAIVKQVRL